MCCSVRNDMCEMFCTRTPEQLASCAVYTKIDKNRLLLQRCKAYLDQEEPTGRLSDIHLLSVHRMMCEILVASATTLCETYVSATDKFRETRDIVGYKRALFTHHGNLHHADLDYHCACHDRRAGDGQDAVLTSTVLDRCASAVCRAYNAHSYVDVQGATAPNISPLCDLIKRMMRTTSVVYTPLVLPPDLMANTKLAANCRQCSRDSVIRGTMTLSGPEAMCTCTISVYKGTNVDGGKHASLVSARHVLFDTTQRSLCMQSPLCGCSVHKKTFSQTLEQLVDALTGRTQ